MSEYNFNSCCCSCGMKKGICIIKTLIELGLIKDSETYYTYGRSLGQINESKYPNFILLKHNMDSSTTEYTNLCIDNITFIKLIPTEDLGESCCQLIINELNKNYVSPFALYTPPDENCCCKSSAAMYLKDKYIEPNPLKRKFIVKVKGINNTIPTQLLESPNSDYKVSVIHLDKDIAWLIDYDLKEIYLVSLCSICALID